ncbi:MAG: hypothetical protein WC533_04580 [Candidatus Pacearchaeota archaeon]
MLNKKGEFDKKGQVTIFIIMAVVVVALIVGFFVFRDSIFPVDNKSGFAEVYSFFDSCIEQKTRQGLSISGYQAGYIELPEFKPGSEYAPFSSQLDFVGSGVPYWFYLSSNGVVKEQVPSMSQIESQLENYLSNKLKECDFSDFNKRGIFVEVSEMNPSVRVKDTEVAVSITGNLVVSDNETSSVRKHHSVNVKSKFGKFYNLAREIYSKETSEAFLENYARDVMYNYAPVTGTEISCSPLMWNPQEVTEDIINGLSANIGALKLDGSYYDLKNKENKYFVVDIKTDDSVSFMYNPDWPTKIEVWPVESGTMIAEPVGLEQGMGILGFCYVPYHFVYDIYFPTLIQIYDDDEIFQFPVAVLIDKSKPRNELSLGEISEIEGTIDEICNYKESKIDVYTYDAEINPVEASIDFQCLNQKCYIGKTQVANGGILSTDFPQCVNAKIIARADGYLTSERIFSTNLPGQVDLLMDKLYELTLDVEIGGREAGDNLVVVNFQSTSNTFSVIYPDQNKVKLAEGDYNISVQVFGKSSLFIPESSTRQCVEVPAPGLLSGIFGRTTENCFDITLPSQNIDNALVAGGRLNEYILESELKGKTRAEINVPALPTPNSLEQLQKNYELVNTNSLGWNIK